MKSYTLDNHQLFSLLLWNGKVMHYIYNQLIMIYKLHNYNELITKI